MKWMMFILLALVACGGGQPQGADAPKSSALEPGAPPKAGDFPEEMRPLNDFLDKKDYGGGAAFLAQHADACTASKDCAFNAEILYYNWSIEYENAGDWVNARKTLQDCVSTIRDRVCASRLEDLESRHRF